MPCCQLLGFSFGSDHIYSWKQTQISIFLTWVAKHQNASTQRSSSQLLKVNAQAPSYAQGTTYTRCKTMHCEFCTSCRVQCAGCAWFRVCKYISVHCALCAMFCVQCKAYAQSTSCTGKSLSVQFTRRNALHCAGCSVFLGPVCFVHQLCIVSHSVCNVRATSKVCNANCANVVHFAVCTVTL